MSVLSKVKKSLEYKLFIRTAVATIENVEECNAVLEETFAYAMKNNGFAFTHFDNFVDSLKNIFELGGKTYIVKYKKKMVGTISIKPMEIDKWYYTGKVYELCHFAVLPKYQKLGLGSVLFDMVVAKAKEDGLNIVLSTPEKNSNVVRYYEKRGFSRIRMFFVKDHYACRFIMFTGEDAPFSREELRAEYEKSALLCLMKHYQECNEIADLEVRKKWNSQFYKYYKDEPDDVQLEMRKRFKKKGTTPKKFVRQREKKQQEQAVNQLALAFYLLTF